MEAVQESSRYNLFGFDLDWLVLDISFLLDGAGFFEDPARNNANPANIPS